MSTVPDLTTWYDGIDKQVLVTALIGIHNKVHFRCRACHSKEPHAKYALCPRDLALEGTHHNPIALE